MPITPYTQPIKYEYKPMNLQAFAQPLSQMQEKFDIATDAVENASFDLSHLPYGTDPERAKELIKMMEGKADDLANNLATTKNYKQAVTKLKELNKLWTSDPELNALQSNYKTWTERDKAEKERIDKPGGIKRNQYLQWKNDEIRKYEENKGTSFKADYLNPEGTYNSVTGNVGRLADLDKEFRDLQIEVAKMNPEKVSTYFKQNVPSMSESELVSLEGTIKSKDAGEIAIETEKYLRRIPKFQEWGKEVAKYNFYDETGYGKDLTKVGTQLVDRTLERIDQELTSLSKDKTLKDSPKQKELEEVKKEYQEMKEKGEYNPDLIQKLYTQQHLDKLYGSEDIANILAYRNVTQNHSIRTNKEWEKAASGGGGGGDKDLFGSWIGATGDSPRTIPTITKDLKKAKEGLREYVSKANDLGKGVMRKLTHINKNAGDITGMYERQKVIANAISSGQTFDQFKQTLKKNGMGNADDGAVRAVYQMLKPKPNGEPNYALQTLNDQVSGGTTMYGNYINDSENLHTIRKAVQGTDEFTKFSSELGNYHVNPVADLPSKAIYTFDASNYTAEQLKKAGIKLESLRTYNFNSSDGKGLEVSRSIKTLSLDQVAKLKGYKNAIDAANKGYSFEGASKSGVKISNIISGKTEELSVKNNTVQEMNFRLNDAPAVDKSLKGQYQTIQDLQTEGDMKGQPGFDDNGNARSGTKIDYSNGKMPKLQFQGNVPYVLMPITSVDHPDGTYVTVKIINPKNLDRVLKSVIQSNQGTDNTSIRTKETAYNNLFTLKYPETNINQVKADNIDLEKSNRKTASVGTITNVPAGTGSFELVKVKTDGDDIYRWKDINVNEYMPGTFKDVNEARSFMGELTSGY